MRLAYSMCGDPGLSEDAVQACWQKAWGSRNRIRDWDHIRGWLFTVTANEVRRQLRRRRLGEILHGRLGWSASTGDLNPHHVDLAQALQGLSLRDRQLIGMRFGLGMTSDEIAPHIGLSASGTRVRLSRVLERLRRDLDHA